MDEILTPDICIIGAGPAGSALAKAAAAVGANVVLVEKGAMAGESNAGDGPAMAALIEAARLAHDARSSIIFGLATDAALAIDFDGLRRQMRSASEALAPNDSAARMTALNVRVIRAVGRFVAKDRVKAGGYEIRARRFALATGARVDLDAASGLDRIAYLTPRTLCDLNDAPAKLLVLGGEPTNLALAQAFRRLGSAVTVVVPRGERALASVDPEFAAVVLMTLQREGVELHEGAEAVAVESASDGIRMRFRAGAAEEVVEASRLLISAARRPQVEDLALPIAGVVFNRGGVVTDRSFRTANRRVFALGDVVGEPWIGRSADYQAGIVMRAALLRWPASGRPHVAPQVVPTDPEIATVGLSEADARLGSGSIRVWRWPFADTARAQGEHKTLGHIKIVASARGRVLGVGLVAPGASELIAPWQMAAARRARVSEMAGLVCAPSSRSEAGRRAALASLLPQLRGPWLRRALRAARWLG